MDFLRQHSTPFADTSGEMSMGVPTPPHGASPKGSGRLPALWKTLKAKFGAMSTSRSATNLASFAAQECGPSCPPPSALTVTAYQDRSVRPFCKRQQSMFLSRTSPDGGLAREVQTAPFDVANNQPLTPQNVSGTSSPTGIYHSTNTLLERPGDVFDSATSNLTAKAMAEPATQSAAPGSSSPSSGLPKLVQNGNPSSAVVQADASLPPAAPSSAQPTSSHSSRKLLAVSPALPTAMRRAVWTLEDYSISRRIFKGGSSAVYKATCQRSGLPVALKVYFLSRVPVNVVHMLKREIEIHTQLIHKNVARLHAAFMDDRDRVVLVQEFAAQGDLYGVMQRMGGRMPPEKVAGAVMRPFLEALAYMHSRGVCHRDIKPENILFTGSWRLLVADFGVSIDLSRERAVTRAGTEGYMAPEVERCPLKNSPQDNKDDPRYAYSAAVDIWAVGVLAYELMVGFPPVVRSEPTASASAASPDGTSTLSGFVKSQMTAAALHFPASVPSAARSFILDALVADPLERPTAAQLLQHPWLQRPPAAVAVAGAAALPATATGPVAVPYTAGSPAAAPAATSGAVPAALQRLIDVQSIAASAPASAPNAVTDGVVAASPPPGQWPLARVSLSASPVLCTPA